MDATVNRAEALAELENIRGFLDGWDGAGSRAIADTAVEAARAFLTTLPATSVNLEVSPSCDGAVQLFFDEPEMCANIIFYTDILHSDGRGRIAYYADCRGMMTRGNGPWAAGDPIPTPLNAVLTLMAAA